MKTVHGGFRWVMGLIALVLVLIPATVIAQDNDGGDDGSLILQVNRPVTVEAGDTADAVVVIDDDVVIDGEVGDALWVVNGTATVNGTVRGSVVVMEGELILADGATVDDVTLIRSDLNRADGATVTGDITERSEYASWSWGWTLLGGIVWVGFAIAMLLVAILVVYLLGGRLPQMSASITARPLESGVIGLATWVILPLLAIITFITIIGIPISLMILLVLIPVVGLVGHIVAGHWVGSWLTRSTGWKIGTLLTVIIGIVLLWIIGLVPFIGGLVTFIATMMGTGAFIHYFYRARRGERGTAAMAQGAPQVG
jgi:hypothetical protein